MITVPCRVSPGDTSHLRARLPCGIDRNRRFPHPPTPLYGRGMFQTFDVLSSPQDGPPRLARLRAELKRRRLSGFVVPRADEYQNEYIPASSDRLRWLTGFTGSAGTAIVMAESAALVTDGRYVLQASRQVDQASFEVVHSADVTLEAWIGNHLPKKGILGIDPWLHTANQIALLKKVVEEAGGRLEKLANNPLDAIWQDRPAPPQAKIMHHPLSLAGEDVGDKLARVRDALGSLNASHFVLTQTDAIAWLFNIRGGDVAHAPLPLAFALLPRKGKVQLFIDPQKIDADVRAALKPTTELFPPAAFADKLAQLAQGSNGILVDPASAAAAIADIISDAGGKLIAAADPVHPMKAPKNSAELAGTRAAHRRDGTALVHFLHWFDQEAPKGKIDEIAAAIALEKFRAASGELRDISFPTIVGAGPNGAIIHYRPTVETNRLLDRDSLFLVDSGGQYQDGTTDVTRTLAVGTPSSEMRRRYTLVLKGMIAISRAVFPAGTSGTHLDALARQFLWREGLDYDHGTGHGVGSYLSVHEGPQRISKAPSAALEPGMIISNEPGFYKPGAYGIRLENLLVVTPLEVPTDGERAMMGFETLTLAPFDRHCIDARLLDIEERAWLDAYHARVLREIGPTLSVTLRNWLAKACCRL